MPVVLVVDRHVLASMPARVQGFGHFLLLWDVDQLVRKVLDAVRTFWSWKYDVVQLHRSK